MCSHAPSCIADPNSVAKQRFCFSVLNHFREEKHWNSTLFAVQWQWKCSQCSFGSPDTHHSKRTAPQPKLEELQTFLKRSCAEVFVAPDDEGFYIPCHSFWRIWCADGDFHSWMIKLPCLCYFLHKRGICHNTLFFGSCGFDWKILWFAGYNYAKVANANCALLVSEHANQRKWRCDDKCPSVLAWSVEL